MDRVEWLQSALDELAAIWIQADSNLRRAITVATNSLERQLESDPFANSQPYSNGRRVLFSAPVGVTYRVAADGQHVSVIHVWIARDHNGQPQNE
jgi:hypothetical protein